MPFVLSYALGISEDAQIIVYQAVKIFVHHLYCYGKYERKEAGVRFLPAPHLPYSWHNFADFFIHILMSFSENGKGKHVRATNINSPFRLCFQNFKETKVMNWSIH